MALPAGERLLAIERDLRFATLALAYLLLTPSPDLRRACRRERACLALAVSCRLNSRKYPSRLRFDLIQRAWAEVARGFAEGGDLGRATEALTLAVLAADQGSGDPLDQAHLLECAAVIRRRQGREMEARRLLRHAHRLYLEIGDHAAAAALNAGEGGGRRGRAKGPALAPGSTP
jgi:hypothetical protein